jgi:hypothetical protein
MVTLSTAQLREQHEILKQIIVDLRNSGADKNIILRLATYTNQFLYDNMCRSMLEKDSEGNYINDENKTK